MPPAFRQRPSRRRERSLTANTLVTGFNPSEIQHGNRRAVLLPRRAERDSDGRILKTGHHWKRYAVGQRLAIKHYVPGPTAFHVRVIHVSPATFTFADVDRQIARELGQVRLDAFWRHWITNNDSDWHDRNSSEDDHVTDAEIARRFTSHWNDKAAWLLRFDIDTESAPRLLARGGGGGEGFRTDADGRWVHSPRDTDREGDRGYTTSDSLSLEGELPALSDTEWATHVGPKSPYRIAERISATKAETWQVRYASAREEARARGKDVRSECRRFDLLIAQGKTEKAMRQLDLIEARCFPVAA